MSDGLYLVRMEQSVLDENGTIVRATLFISLYDGDALKAVVSGDAAIAVYEHFQTLGDHDIRDSFIDGVLMTLQSMVTGSVPTPLFVHEDVIVLATPLSPDARVSA